MADSTTTTAADHGLDQSHENSAAAYGEGHDAHAGDYHGPELGRYLVHPPEPPHILQMLYKFEQKALIRDYVSKHPGQEAPSVLENWLVKDEQGEWKAVEGQAPTFFQTLHAGRLTKEVPLVGYAPWENHVFMGLSIAFLIGSMYVLTGSLRRDRLTAMKSPTRTQTVAELIIGGLDDFCKGVLGEKNGRFYLPYIGTMFLLILVSNLMGMVPLMKPPTSSLLVTFSLALCTFFVVQATAWVRLGPLTYMHHLMGSPKDLIGWALSPLFLLLELISDFVAKPLSLALRLFGNILGKDILFGVFLSLGILLVAAVSEPASHFVGIPLTIPFYALGLLLSTIQALVFSLLSCIYILMVLPHDHDHEHGDHHDDHGHGHGHHKAVVSEPVPH